MDGFLIPKRPKIDLGAPGVVAVGVGMTTAAALPADACSCSLSDV
jgi:hypothetical protein